jgi:integrase
MKRFLAGIHIATAFVFHSRCGSPLRETNVLVNGLHPALKAVALPRAGMHAFRHGCNRRWELAESILPSSGSTWGTAPLR